MTSRQNIGPLASPPSEGAPRSPPPRWERRLLVCLVATSAVLLLFTLAGVARARADSVAYLIDVTVRSGYNFANPSDALAYGQRLCDKVSHGHAYADLVGDVESDLHTDDQFLASYVIDKTINELSPAQIWQLRNSAAHYATYAG